MSKFIVLDDNARESIAHINDDGHCTHMSGEKVADLLNLAHVESCELRQCRIDRDRVIQQVSALSEEVERLQLRVRQLESEAVPNERGTNRYGLDVAYFRNLINRELNRPLVDHRPDELARVFARASAAADPNVMREIEFNREEKTQFHNANI